MAFHIFDIQDHGFIGEREAWRSGVSVGGNDPIPETPGCPDCRELHDAGGNDENALVLDGKLSVSGYFTNHAATTSPIPSCLATVSMARLFTGGTRPLSFPLPNDTQERRWNPASRHSRKSASCVKRLMCSTGMKNRQCGPNAAAIGPTQG